MNRLLHRAVLVLVWPVVVVVVVACCCFLPLWGALQLILLFHSLYVSTPSTLHWLIMPCTRWIDCYIYIVLSVLIRPAMVVVLVACCCWPLHVMPVIYSFWTLHFSHWCTYFICACGDITHFNLHWWARLTLWPWRSSSGKKTEGTINIGVIGLKNTLRTG